MEEEVKETMVELSVGIIEKGLNNMIKRWTV